MVYGGSRLLHAASGGASESELRQCLQHPSRNQANEEGRKEQEQLERRDIFLVLCGVGGGGHVLRARKRCSGGHTME